MHDLRHPPRETLRIPNPPQARRRIILQFIAAFVFVEGIQRARKHHHIGKGEIGLAAFRFIMNDRRFRKIPKVLETPKGKEMKEDVVNLKKLRKLITQRPSSRAQARDLANGR